MRRKALRFFEIALVLARLNHVARFIVNANDEKRFVVYANEKLTAFVELESAIRCGHEAVHFKFSIRP